MNTEKINLAKNAVELVEDGMIIGVGAGTTIDLFVQELIDYVNKNNLHIKFVSASSDLNQKASVNGVTVLEVSNVSEIDLYFDGADFVNVDSKLVSKGNGGFIYNENYLVQFASQSFLLIDESKLNFERLPKIFLEVKEDFIAEAFNVLAGYTFFVREELSESGNLVIEVVLDNESFLARFVDFDLEHSCILASGTSKNRYSNVWIARSGVSIIDKINLKS